MCKLRCKLHNAKNLPPWGPNFTNIFFISFYGQLRQLFHISEHTISKRFFFNLNFCFLVEAPWCLKTYVNCVTNLKNAKNLPELTWSWKNKPWYISRVSPWWQPQWVSQSDSVIFPISQVCTRGVTFVNLGFLRGHPRLSQGTIVPPRRALGALSEILGRPLRQPLWGH